jgi:hypothetical protein
LSGFLIEWISRSLPSVDVDVEQHALAAEPQQRGGLPVGADAHVVAHLPWRRMAAT